MNVNEIIVNAYDTITDKSILIDISDVNAAVLFIASLSYLPDLVVEGVVTFNSTAKIIINATNASPIVLTTDEAHGFDTGAVVVVANVLGNTAANGTWYIENLTDTTFRLLNSDGNGDYISGGIVTKRDAYVNMPGNYHHDLFEAFSITDDAKLYIRSNLKALASLHTVSGRINGDLEDVTVENDKLYGMPIPQSDNIVICKYYRKPDTMTLTSEIPTCIPLHLHENLIVSEIVSRRQLQKNDSANKAAENFNTGIANLLAYYPKPSMQKAKIKRYIHFF